MSGKDEIVAKNHGDDDNELNDLLSSALDDFDKNKKGDEKSVKETEKESTTDEVWNEQFIAEQARLFEEKMAALFGSGEGGEAPSTETITAGFQKMAEAAALALKPDTENMADPQFTSSITEALKGLNEGQENLQSPFNPEDLAGMFGNLDMAGGDGANSFLPFMQGMMQSLLSAEVLLPSLTDLIEKYPKWLEENSGKISTEDKERYIKQQELMQLVCDELKKEKPDDSAEIKKLRFHKVLENMQMMQELGQPPADLVGDAGAPGMPNLDPAAMGAMGDPSQCSLM